MIKLETKFSCTRVGSEAVRINIDTYIVYVYSAIYVYRGATEMAE